MTTVFIPMPEWQALAFLRDRQSAFNRLVNQLGEPIFGEVVLRDDKIYGLKDRARAVANGRETHPQGFTILRISFGKMVSGYMTYQRQLVSVNHPETDAPAYAINREGLLLLLQKIDALEAELLMDEIFEAALPEAPIVGPDSCGPSGLDAQWLPPSNTSASTTAGGNPRPLDEVLGAGPTGLGGC